MELDFSRLDNLAYRGIKTAEGRAAMDTLVPQGFTLLEGFVSPFDEDATEREEALKRNLEPSTGICEGRNYSAMYEAAYAYHRRYSPPQDVPDYWEKAVGDIGSVARRFGNNPLIIGLLSAIFAELEREYKALRQGMA